MSDANEEKLRVGNLRRELNSRVKHLQDEFDSVHRLYAYLEEAGDLSNDLAAVKKDIVMKLDLVRFEFYSKVNFILSEFEHEAEKIIEGIWKALQNKSKNNLSDDVQKGAETGSKGSKGAEKKSSAKIGPESTLSAGQKSTPKNGIPLNQDAENIATREEQPSAPKTEPVAGLNKAVNSSHVGEGDTAKGTERKNTQIQNVTPVSRGGIPCLIRATPKKSSDQSIKPVSKPGSKPINLTPNTTSEDVGRSGKTEDPQAPSGDEIKEAKTAGKPDEKGQDVPAEKNIQPPKDVEKSVRTEEPSPKEADPSPKVRKSGRRRIPTQRYLPQNNTSWEALDDKEK